MRDLNLDVSAPSKRHENLMRFVAFSLLAETGLNFVSAWLDDIKKQQKYPCSRGLPIEQLRRNCSGILAEVRFFCSRRNELRLVPTLDAGCQFDFLGVSDGRITCYDVTTSVESKRNSNVPVAYGDLKWPVVIAHVFGERIRYYSVSPVGVSDSPTRSEEMAFDCSAELINPGSKIDNAMLRIFTERHDMFYRLMTHNDSLDNLLKRNEGLESDSSQRLLMAHLKFFHTYRYALNLLPALSYGDGIDFVGQHGSQMAFYHLLLDGVSASEGDQRFNLRYAYDDPARLVFCDLKRNRFTFEHCDSPLFEMSDLPASDFNCCDLK